MLEVEDRPLSNTELMAYAFGVIDCLEKTIDKANFKLGLELLEELTHNYNCKEVNSE